MGYEVSNVFSYAFYKGVWAPVLTSQLVWEHQISSLGLLSLKPSFSFLLYQRNHQETLVALDTLVLDSFPEKKTVEEGVLVGHCHLVLAEVGLVAEFLWEKEPD